MNFQVIRPNGSQMKAIVHITLARILKATLVLKGLVIEWVIVKGCNEGGSTDSETDLWQESDYQVFRKITDNANAAMLNFSSPMYPEYGLKSFIVSVPLLFQRKKEKKSVIYFLFVFRLTSTVSTLYSPTSNFCYCFCGFFKAILHFFLVLRILTT